MADSIERLEVGGRRQIRPDVFGPSTPAHRFHLQPEHSEHRHRKTGRRYTKKLLYAAWRVGGSPVEVRDLYRRRFGVESSYRQLGQVRPRTSTTDGVVRLLWVAVGLVVRNAWVRFGSGRGRGWTLGAACLLLLVEILGTRPSDPTEPPHTEATTTQARPPT